ncbi:MAG: undecaprenyldiphospho-muramoylpentapeptide beta-N-acetylglucosaminyltransferase [Paraglaciecola sp.]|uniref:undecaprenyldiphospho-muramoylpentapeptide beta-N-acetylglucosaminyltransferase n=1 Tax=Pseudomonadati TaxID=3379134 RepID=UPI00274012EA|nr:undecaprenyldiphospho-muramoylpentapeptide beta-N-acetylglucosaminyltransferase [Paraglaciecola sp.]MDP5029726.1 undecaprenyldiphospho-muramoylpentapeptide beta-N-acetylglucosaminyltransferase [Paraglaciecola sp.]MDP5131656.1 undecaprenyldiphospho-muramoylpentapeptide beta-N-acetylglucosaminyltransferase [Paraglaciecola sp.]
MTKRLLVMAGGTGGHVFPGLSVAQLLADKNWQIHWLGTSERMEAQLVPQAGFPISFIDVVGVRNNGLLRLIAAPFKIIKSVLQAKKIIKSFEPDVVLGLGGFASGPGGIAAWLANKPLVVHEQNAAPGMTNRILARLAKKVLTGFANTFEAQQASNNTNDEKYQWVGNPVRAAFATIPVKSEVTLPLNILVVGGSLGAQILNQVVPLALVANACVNVRHQTGKGHLDEVTRVYQQSLNGQDNWQLSEFIDDIPAAYAWADLVICRAGALTVAEVAAAGVCAIFVPLPHAVDDHQTKNAQVLADAGAAYLLPQSGFTVDALQNLITHCLSQPEKLILMSQKAKTLACLDAAQHVATICEQLAGRCHD